MSDAHSLEPLLQVKNLKQHFPVTAGLLRRQVGTIKAVAEFFRIGAQFAGQTEIAIGAKGRELPSRTADVEGEMSETDVSLDLRIHEGPLKAYRFHCEGTADADGNRYEGRWHAPCLNPGNCGCDGTRDDFVMVRLD